MGMLMQMQMLSLLKFCYIHSGNQQEQHNSRRGETGRSVFFRIIILLLSATHSILFYSILFDFILFDSSIQFDSILFLFDSIR